MLKILRTRKALQAWRKRELKRTLGFVPTMGALHEGHLSLMRRSKKENALTLVSIFVNPTQFGPKEDFRKYPRREREDLKLLRSLKVDAVFLPKSIREIYPEGESGTRIVPPASLTEILEGQFRPGHFTGVATVVTKLLMLSRPTRSYFGKKDFQQLQVIEALANDLFLDVEIVPCETKRAPSGLALSSRNQYLDPEARTRAASLSAILKSAGTETAAKRELKKAGFQVQYVAKWRGRRLAAAYFQGVRLIDNVARFAQHELARRGGKIKFGKKTSRRKS